MPESDPIPEQDDEKCLLEDRIRALQTDLRQKKEIILAQHTKLEAFLESSIDALVQMDFDGHITGWNRQAEKIFGWSADEILDRKIEDTIIPVRYRAAHAEGMKRFLATGESTVMNTLIEIHALHRDGHEFPVELSISVIALSRDRVSPDPMFRMTSGSATRSAYHEMSSFDHRRSPAMLFGNSLLQRGPSRSAR